MRAVRAGPMGASGPRRAAAGPWASPRTMMLALAATVILAPLAATALAAPGTASVSYGGAEYAVAYDAAGVSVDAAYVEEVFTSIILDVRVDGPGTGTLEVVLERALIDARDMDGQEDIEFIVIYDGGEEAAVEEIETTDASRTIRFSLPAGSDEVTVIGTDLGGGGAGAPPAEPAPAGDPPAPPAEPAPAGDPPVPPAEPAPQGQDPPAPEPFVEPGADPVEDYVKRYATEPAYAAWFDENFGGQYGSICEAVGLGEGCVEEYNAAAAEAAAAAAAAAAAQQQAPPSAPSGPESFVDPAVNPYEEYVKRYVEDAGFRAWFDESYPDRPFCDAVGLEDGCIEVYNVRAAAAAEEVERLAREVAETEAAAAEAEAAAAAAAAAAEADAAALRALEESCGEGTVLRDGACVALPPPRDPVGSGRELATGLVAAFVIALAAGAAFWLLHRAGRRGRPQEGAAAGGGGTATAGPGAGMAAASVPSGGWGAAPRGGDAGDDEPRGRGTIV